MALASSLGSSAVGTQSNGSWAGLPNLFTGDNNDWATWTSSSGNVWGQVAVTGYDFSAYGDDWELEYAVVRIRQATGQAARHNATRITVFDGSTQIGAPIFTPIPGVVGVDVSVAIAAMTLANLKSPNLRVEVYASRTNQGGSVGYALATCAIDALAYAPGQRPNMAAHLAALRRTEPIGIWLLGSESELEEVDTWPMVRALDAPIYWHIAGYGPGENPAARPVWGRPGPFPDAHSIEFTHGSWSLWNYPNASDWRGYWWPQSLRQPRMTWACWINKNPYAPALPPGAAMVFGNLAVSWRGAVPVNDYGWWWWYADRQPWADAGVAWPGGVNPLGPFPNALAFDSTRWWHICIVMDGNQARAYVNGGQAATGTLSPAPSTGEPSVVNMAGHGARFAALAIWDRALTDLEVAELPFAYQIPAAITKVYTAQGWQEANVGGWAGAGPGWRGAKVWTGSRWQEL
jgi:hypothetical protein